MFIKCIALLFFSVLGGYAEPNQQCDGYPDGHSMCLSPASEEECEGVKCGLTEWERRRIVHIHNRYRNKVASGKELRGAPGPQPRATNMALITWDEELETIAQRWADQLRMEHDCSDCRRIRTGEYAGQNFAVRAADSAFTVMPWARVIDGWYNEVDSMNGEDTADGKFEFSQEVGHFSQVLWANTTKVGCGVRASNGPCMDSLNCVFAVCNYLPGGNVPGEPVYSTSGDLCGHTDEKYKFLCV